MKSKEILKQAFIKSVPILCSYIVVSMAYGMMMENAGFHWYASLFYKPYGLYRSVSVCADNVPEQ